MLTGGDARVTKDVSRCVVCECTEHASRFRAREMYTGEGREFSYVECRDCQTVRIENAPTDLTEYYGGGYYSFESPVPKFEKLRNWLDRLRLDDELGPGSSLGWLINKIASPLSYVKWLKETGAHRQAKVLDVGSGSGRVMYRMAIAGIDVTGLDPFIDKDTRLPATAVIFRRDIEGHLRECDQRYDLIMFNHSLEHTSEPRAQLNSARELLRNSGGRILVRLPLAGGYCHRKYGSSWFHLTPPLHVFIPSLAGMKVLAERAGLTIVKYWFESSSFHIANCEMISRGLDLQRQNARALFSAEEWEEFEMIVRQADTAEQGDQAAFVLQAV